jgi:hypothetical protein
MRLTKFGFTFLALLLAVVSAFAADVNGKWVAQVPGRGGQTQDVTFNFKAEGDQLTGTVTSRRGETNISDGKVQGDEISFVQVMEFNGNQVKLVYKGKVSGDEIKFSRQREGGERTQEFTAKRGA